MRTYVENIRGNVDDVTVRMKNVVTNETLKKSFKEQLQGMVTNKELERTILQLRREMTKGTPSRN